LTSEQIARMRDLRARRVPWKAISVELEVQPGLLKYYFNRDDPRYIASKRRAWNNWKAKRTHR
jgi:hypothetical protein